MGACPPPPPPPRPRGAQLTRPARAPPPRRLPGLGDRPRPRSPGARSARPSPPDPSDERRSLAPVPSLGVFSVLVSAGHTPSLLPARLHAALSSDVLQGLTAPLKWLPPKWL